jgi:hypothetical protein
MIRLRPAFPVEERKKKKWNVEWIPAFEAVEIERDLQKAGTDIRGGRSASPNTVHLMKNRVYLRGSIEMLHYESGDESPHSKALRALK